MSAVDTDERAAVAPVRHRPPGMCGRWFRPWLAVVRLARHDAVRHRARTILATLLVALPIAALVGGTVLTQASVPSRDVALASIPDGVQAVITAATVKQPAPPLAQVPEVGEHSWYNDLAQRPATGAELAAVLPGQDQLLQFWTSPQLLMTNALELQPGQQEEAGARALASVETARISSGTLTESGPQALALLVPKLSAGSMPADSSEVVLTTALAQRLGVSTGEVITLIAPPRSIGFSSASDRLGSVIADSQRGYRVSGLVEDAKQNAWSQAGWISESVARSPGGVEGKWLAVGEEPVTWEATKELNALQAVAVSRNVLENYPTDIALYPVPLNPVEVLNRIVSLVVTGLVGGLMVLFLVTPAFAVSTDQSRRTLGMAAATGATPRDLRRIVTAQGLVVGTMGGIGGGALGFLGGMAMRAVRQTQSGPVQYPWWILPLGVGVAAVLGIIATWLPARTAGRMKPVDAIKDQSGQPSQGRSSRVRRFLSSATGPLLLLAGVACGALSLVLPLPKILVTPESIGGSGDSTLLVSLMIAALVLFVLGLAACLRSLVGSGARFAGRLRTLPRLALRDADDHKNRFLPAAAGIMVAVLAAVFLATSIGSSIANFRSMSGSLISTGQLLVGPAVPVNEEFNRIVVEDAIDNLAARETVVSRYPIYSVPQAQPLRLGILMPVNNSCPEGEAPDGRSSLVPGSPLVCVGRQFAHQTGGMVAWQGGDYTFIMDADALRSTGLPGAEAAADVLEAGGAVVHNAAMVSDTGTVRIAAANEVVFEEKQAKEIVTVPGAFMPGFGGSLTISAATAARMGISHPEFMGYMVELAPGKTPGQVAQAADSMRAGSSLVVAGAASLPYPWGSMDRLLPLVLLGLVAMAAAVISIMLARTQSLRDAATMHAVGATPKFLRRFTLVQAAVVLGASVPLGALAGLGLGWYLMAWRRRTAIGVGDGPWLEFVPMWGVQGALLASVIAAGLLTALIIGRPPKHIVRRSID